ncbi:cytochrome P450 [Thermomonospora cellulosilytica]|uniref:Cytochrome P450 n=1 Tax=Thermomonospora cellulosilytica TaxID=1411118 RepID=A0A7W3N4L2_9ACTN|nr:cytochrome P450 [Thermomonospora cellulosilytica]MBA9007415.1 cytochrome P450 [Thermomonospora cellulosilytica]
MNPGSWERRLYLAAHPFAYPLLRGLARCGPAVRVPGVGVVVNDAALARRVLLDGETFRKDGPGSPGELWTPVLGPSVLLNMEGEAHRALRRKLTDLFTPGYAERLCAEILAEPLERLAARLARGEEVDLVDTMRVMAGAVIGDVIGLAGRTTATSPRDRGAREVVPPQGIGDEDGYRHLFEQGERIVSMVSLRTRRLSPAQIERARAVLGPLGDIAAEAYAAGDENTVMGRMRLLGLSEDEARGAAGAFFLTGTETVATYVPRLIALLHDSGELDRVAADRSLLGAALDEAMRYITPTPVMLRSVHAPARIGGARVRPGDRVLIITHNCCRAYGPFDLDRPHPPELRRLWFGAGPHFCIGYPIAMAEVRAVASTVLDAAPLTVVRRRAARGVLIPTYREFVVRRRGAP